MRNRAIISIVSAAALTGSLGLASTMPPRAAAQTAPDPQTQNPQSSPSKNATRTSLQVASEAASVLLQNAPESNTPATTEQIPRQFVNAAQCVAVFPNVNGNETTTGTATTSGTSASTGTVRVAGAAMPNARLGVASCRDESGKWQSGAPVFVAISGLQAMGTSSAPGPTAGIASDTNNPNGGTSDQYGASGLALVLLFMNADAADALQAGNLARGSGVHIAAGPLTTNARVINSPTPVAPVLAYWTTNTYNGSLEGGSTFNTFKGASIGFASEANAQVYGQDVDPRALLSGNVSRKERRSGSRQLAGFSQALQRFAPSSRFNPSTSVAK